MCDGYTQWVDWRATSILKQIVKGASTFGMQFVKSLKVSILTHTVNALGSVKHLHTRHAAQVCFSFAKLGASHLLAIGVGSRSWQTEATRIRTDIRRSMTGSPEHLQSSTPYTPYSVLVYFLFLIFQGVPRLTLVLYEYATELSNLYGTLSKACLGKS